MNTKIHIGDIIKQVLKEKRHSVAWLARRINKDPSNLRKTLKKESLNSDLLYRISKVLNHNFSNYYKL